ncbi:MAG TPA: hypothetical protein VIL37_04650 [Natronosporangium sp.]
MDQHASSPRLGRRQFGLAVAGSAIAATIPATVAGTPAAAQPDSATVRLGTVPALETGGLLDQLLAAFEAASGYQVSVSVGSHAAVFSQARAGLLEVVLTHWGVDEVRLAVADRVGRWPQLVLSTSFVLIGPAADPAHVRHLDDPVQAVRRIARRRVPFIVNDLSQPRFVYETLWHAADRPDRQGWVIDTGLRGPAAVAAAAAQGGYTIWGLHPFLTLQSPPPGLRGITYTDSLMQRGIASLVVNPDPTRPVNLAGGLALEQFLVAPEAQALIRSVRHPGLDQPIFWPAGIHNGND